MGVFVDLTERAFGRWIVICRGANVGTVTRWLCRCLCGTTRLVRAGHLINGASTSCGCNPKPVRHGQASGKFTKKYRTWRQVKARCCNPKHKNANIYAGLLCPSWQVFEGFDAGVPDPPGDEYTIDRIDNSKGYEPGNVRWVLMPEQHRNQRNCRWIEHNGKTQLLSDWARDLGVTTSTLHARIKKWGIPKSLDR